MTESTRYAELYRQYAAHYEQWVREQGMTPDPAATDWYARQYADAAAAQEAVTAWPMPQGASAPEPPEPPRFRGRGLVTAMVVLTVVGLLLDAVLVGALVWLILPRLA